MSWVDDWGLTLATFLPALGVLVLMFLPNRETLVKITGTAFAGVALIAGVICAVRFDYGASDQIQLEVNSTWIESIGARYHVGVDGMSLPLLLLSLLVCFLCMIYMWWHIPEPGKPKALFALVLLLETGMNGTFVALDLILFFIFFELVLVPMYFMIGIWGGPNRDYASVKFFLYTLFGSIFMLLGFLALWINSGNETFDMIALQDSTSGASELFQNLVFLGLFLGFAIKVPMWPFHTWLPDAHTEAPTVGSVLLAAVLLKMGTYGFIRIALPILPDAAVTFAPLIGILAVIGIIWGSLCCFAQTDLKRLIAFSSVGHMGFVMLGIATLTDTGINGAVFGMVAHGLITGMLFFLAGSIHERYHTREIAELGGVLKQIPQLRHGFLVRGDRITGSAGARRVLGRDARPSWCVSTGSGAKRRVVPGPHGHRRDRDRAHRGVPPVDGPESQPRHGARQVRCRQGDLRRPAPRVVRMGASPPTHYRGRFLSGPAHERDR